VFGLEREVDWAKREGRREGDKDEGARVCVVEDLDVAL
jgi:orotate phosphoribosyltransferase